MTLVTPCLDYKEHFCTQPVICYPVSNPKVQRINPFDNWPEGISDLSGAASLFMFPLDSYSSIILIVRSDICIPTESGNH